MKIVNLVVHGVYYDLIKKGKKTKEYRAITEYYVKRFMTGGTEMSVKQRENLAEELETPSKREETMKKWRTNIREDYTHVLFRRGTTPTTMLVKLKNIELYGNNFVLNLGEIENGDMHKREMSAEA